MKLFSCFNARCPSHKPGTATQNNVMQCVVVLTPVDDYGNPLEYEDAAQAVDHGYECGLCGSPVEEYTVKRAMVCRIERVTPTHLVGVFSNAFRGDAMFNFALDLKTGGVQVKEPINLSREEEEVIQEYCRLEYYENGIIVEVIDADRSRHECTVFNKTDRVMISAVVEGGRVVEQRGERDLHPLEKRKLLEVVGDLGI